MSKEEYRKYLYSKKWLLKKNELISTYLKQNWDIKCAYCDKTDRLQVHHASYKNIGNEILTDERIWELRFVCSECHKKIHFQKNWLIEKEEESMKKMFENLKNLKKSIIK